MTCLFCSISEKTIPADIVFEDEKVIAFRDINPQAPSHLLIIPRLHISTLNEILPEHNYLIGHMFQTAKALALQEGVQDNGYRLVMNCNNDGGQTVFHIHLHLLAGRHLNWPPG